MKIDQLISIAAHAGIALAVEPVTTANLYVLIDEDRNDLYVGKAASKARHENEDRWKSIDHKLGIFSGFVALAAENNAERIPLRYKSDEFDPLKLAAVIDTEEWKGGAIATLLDRLDEGRPPTAEEVERILVRIHVRMGCLIGNSQYASQWEGPIGSVTDTIAALAIDSHRISSLKRIT